MVVIGQSGSKSDSCARIARFATCNGSSDPIAIIGQLPLVVAIHLDIYALAIGTERNKFLVNNDVGIIGNLVVRFILGILDIGFLVGIDVVVALLLAANSTKQCQRDENGK